MGKRAYDTLMMCVLEVVLLSVESYPLEEGPCPSCSSLCPHSAQHGPGTQQALSSCELDEDMKF